MFNETLFFSTFNSKHAFIEETKLLKNDKV